MEEEPDYAGIWAMLNPNGKVGKPEDVAATVGFLLRPVSRHITGQTLLVDGGWTSYAPSPDFFDKVREGMPKMGQTEGPEIKETEPDEEPNDRSQPEATLNGIKVVA